MKLINKTDYDTLALKKLFTRCLTELEKLEGKLPQRNRLLIEVKSRTFGTRGKAIYGGYKIWMYISSAKRLKKWVEKKVAAHLGDERYRKWADQVLGRAATVYDVAWVFLHELQHSYGYHHDKISNGVLQKMAEGFCNEYELKMKEPEPAKPKEEIQLKRYNHVIKMISKKESQFKRLSSSLRKWRIKQRRYEKILVAAGKIKNGGER